MHWLLREYTYTVLFVAVGVVRKPMSLFCTVELKISILPSVAMSTVPTCQCSVAVVNERPKSPVLLYIEIALRSVMLYVVQLPSSLPCC